MYSRRELDGAVAYKERWELSYPEACGFGGRSIRKRLRRHGIRTEQIQGESFEGERRHLFDFDYKIILAGKEEYAVVSGVVNTSHIELFCNGPMAEAVVRDVNVALYPWLRTEKEWERIRRAEARKKVIGKRRKRRKALKKHSAIKISNDNNVFIPAPISKKRRERVMERGIKAQFRYSTISWHEAVCSVVAIFEVDNTALIPARERIELRLRQSLEKNKILFAQFKRDGFVLRFDTLDGMWRAEKTEVMISFSKDKKSQFYRRAREYFSKLLQRKSIDEQRVRRQYMLTSSFAYAA